MSVVIEVLLMYFRMLGVRLLVRILGIVVMIWLKLVNGVSMLVLWLSCGCSLMIILVIKVRVFFELMISWVRL